MKSLLFIALVITLFASCKHPYMYSGIDKTDGRIYSFYSSDEIRMDSVVTVDGQQLTVIHKN